MRPRTAKAGSVLGKACSTAWPGGGGGARGHLGLSSFLVPPFSRWPEADVPERNWPPCWPPPPPPCWVGLYGPFCPLGLASFPLEFCLYLSGLFFPMVWVCTNVSGSWSERKWSRNDCPFYR